MTAKGDLTESCSNTTTGTTPSYAVTLATPNQVCVNGTCGPTGGTPVAVQTFGTTTTAGGQSGGCQINYVNYQYSCNYSYAYTTFPSNVITANYSGNSVSVLSLPNMTPVATIPVGDGPVSVLISPDQSEAFVANYNSASISEINLSTDAVVATLAVGASPSTLALDPSNSYLWVGGNGYISKVGLLPFAVVSTVSVGSQVTALAISAAQNQWVYTTVSSDLSTYEVVHAAIVTSNPTIHAEAALPTANSDFAFSIIPGTHPPS